MGNSRSAPIDHKIRTRDVAAETAGQETGHAGDFGGQAGAFEGGVCFVGL